jgi:hypothetical protein
VFINIYGSLGDSGQVKLEEKGAFKKDSADEFEVELVDVGDITKIRIGHDGAGLGSGWFLNKVVIRNQTTGQEVIHSLRCLFVCLFVFCNSFLNLSRSIDRSIVLLFGWQMVRFG